MTRTIGMGLFLRSTVGQVWFLAYAVKTHPLIAAFLVTLTTIYFESGSGSVAVTATPALWGGGCVAWFVLRTHRTGLTIAQSAAQLRRQDLVRRQWDKACTAAKLPITPPLYRWRVRSEGDTVVARINASAVGLDREPILSGLQKMQEVVGGGCRDARMKALGDSGIVEIRFAWGDPLGKVITPNMLPCATAGTVAFGLTETGAPVYFPLLNDRGEWAFTPLMVVGVTGSGKSSTLWGSFLGMIVSGVPVHLHVSDPKGGMELNALEDALKDGLGTPQFRVVEYADTEDGTTAMVKRMAEQMDKRLAANKARRVRAHVPTTAEPAHVLIIDELLELNDLMKEGKKGALGRLQRLGRAGGFSVIAATQLSRAADLNPQIRDLFAQRLVFRVPSREAVETALGSGNGWGDKAPAHRIKPAEKGVGYIVDFDGKTGDAADAVRFRSVWIDDEQTKDIAAGQVPAGTEEYAREEVDPKAFKHVLYRCYDARMELLYVGETNNWERRMREHRRRSPWWQYAVEDSEHIVREWHFGPTAKDAEKSATVAQTHAIKTEHPLHNGAENQNNPLRIIRGGKGRAA
jgi:hypothetical protein